MKLTYFTLAFMACAFIANAQSMEGSKIGKGIRFMPKDSSFSIQWNTRFQNLYEGKYNLDSEEYNDKFLIRRFRLKFKGYLVNPKLQYKIELAMSNRDQKNANPEDGSNIVLDAVVKYRFHPNWQLWVGQTKLPGNRERVISSGNLQFVDRSYLNKQFTIDRAKGIQIRHEHSLGNIVLREIGAVTMGDGRNNINNNTGGYDYTFRGEILPFGKFTNKGDYFGSDLARESSPKLSIGVTFDYNQDTKNTGGQIGQALEDTESTLGNIVIDAMFKYKGFSFMGEYDDKWVESGDATSGTTSDGSELPFYTGNALNVQAGYLFKSNYEVAGRFTMVQPENTVKALGTDFNSNRYSIGFSKYIAGHTVKIQSTVSYVDYETINDADDEMQFLMQMEIGF
ncbi:MAG: porin [Reichenbachiella sp.]|uniref:porin n=1 Tax=Reichenbachiella sp. TaxID=2184521 RepID=UPI003264E16A